MWPQLSFVREYKLGNDLYEGILDDKGQRRMLPRQAHSSVVALRLSLHQGHAETACLEQTCCCFGDTGKAKWRLLEQFSMSLPLDPALLWAGIWHFRRYEKKKSNVEMKWAILNAPWDFVRWLFHEVSPCCSPGEEEAAQPADLWPPLVSQDGHAVTHVLALM